MSPFVFNADLATISADVRQIRTGLFTDQMDASWEEVTGAESAELTVRLIAADRAGDHAALDAIFGRAAEIDAANPFGERLVDQLEALMSREAAA
jgi:hypothetical protein